MHFSASMAGIHSYSVTFISRQAHTNFLLVLNPEMVAEVVCLPIFKEYYMYYTSSGYIYDCQQFQSQDNVYKCGKGYKNHCNLISVHKFPGLFLNMMLKDLVE